jgi:hypothetical protein
MAATSHTVAVDQGGRIDFTTENTALAFSSDIAFVV